MKRTVATRDASSESIESIEVEKQMSIGVYYSPFIPEMCTLILHLVCQKEHWLLVHVRRVILSRFRKEL